MAYARIDQVIVFELAGDRAAGLYGAVYRVLDRAQLVPDAFMITLFPIIAAAHGVDSARVRRLFGLALDYLAVVSLPLLAFTIVAARPLVRLLFGQSFIAAAPALPVLMGAFVLISVGYLLGNMIIVLGLQRRFIAYAVAALAFNVAANLALVPDYGFQAAAWITLATEALVGGLSARAVLTHIELRPALGRIVRTLVASGLMGGLVAAARAWGAPLGALVAIAVASFGALAFALGAVRRGELVALVRRQPV
jgi:O-antigen/teichoic acid export membrane protein